MMDKNRLAETAQAISKGILAADESPPTIAKRFSSIQVEPTPDNRRDYRELLFTTESAPQYIGGAILSDDTIRQTASDGATSMSELLLGVNIVPGIKVDLGAKPLAGAAGETVTEGLDGLRDRFAEYRDRYQARFAKWRAVIAIGDGIPSRYCIRANAHALGRYAALSQEAGITPIVEPEVLMDGDHSIERCAEVTEATLREVFDELALQRVSLEGIVLKPNMVISGMDAPRQASVEEVAEATLKILRKTVPEAVPGIAFLSGGQSEQLATEHLNAMNRMGSQPWVLSFSYGRALQASALKAWGGKPENVGAAQKAYAHRARCNGLARLGQYSERVEQEALG